MRRALLGYACWLLCGCALFSKGELADRRFFSPPVVTRAPASASSGVELRLGRVTAGACGSERMMVRYSDEEIGFRDERLWTEKPEVYLRRAMELELFEVNGLSSVLRGAAPVLELELVEFEEVLTPKHVGRVTVAWALSDERVVLRRQTQTFELAIALAPGQLEGAAVARALGGAMQVVVTDISTRVRGTLEHTSPRSSQ